MPSTEVSPAPSRDGRRTDTRDRLVESALRLFTEKGYAGTTIAQIEGSVGLRPGGGGLYRHFASKDELLLEAVEGYRDRVKDLRAQLAQQLDTRSPNGRSTATSVAKDLRRLVDTLANFLSGEGPMVQLRVESGGLPEAVRHAVGDAWDEGYGMVIDLFEHHGVPPERSALMAVHALGSLDHYFDHLVVWHQVPAGLSVDDFVAEWVDHWSASVATAGRH